jgi:hypothetical protein
MAVASARSSLPSSSSSPLPPLSPQPVVPAGVERMLVRAGGGTRSLREIDEEEDDDDDDGGKTYVSVGKDLKDGKANIQWAARKLQPQQGDVNKLLVLLHVHQPRSRQQRLYFHFHKLLFFSATSGKDTFGLFNWESSSTHIFSFPYALLLKRLYRSYHTNNELVLVLHVALPKKKKEVHAGAHGFLR